MFRNFDDLYRFLFMLCGFGFVAFALGVCLAISSIWLPITLWQAVVLMGIGGLCAGWLIGKVYP